MEPDYPVAGVHLTLDPNVILIRPRVIDGVFDESCRLQYVDQEGNHYRTRDLLVDIYGTHLVGTIRFTDNRFGIVAYDREAVHVVVCDYRTAFLERVSVPVDQALAADLGAPGAAAARPEIYGMTLRDNGNLVLAGALVTEPETPVDESGYQTDLYTVEINAESLYLDFSDIIGIAARDLRANFDDAETSGNALLSFAEATAHRPSLTNILFSAMDLDGDNMLSYEELESAADYDWKYNPGGVAGCGTGEQRIGGDWALAFAMLGLLLYWSWRGNRHQHAA